MIQHAVEGTGRIRIYQATENWVRSLIFYSGGVAGSIGVAGEWEGYSGSRGAGHLGHGHEHVSFRVGAISYVRPNTITEIVFVNTRIRIRARLGAAFGSVTFAPDRPQGRTGNIPQGMTAFPNTVIGPLRLHGGRSLGCHAAGGGCRARRSGVMGSWGYFRLCRRTLGRAMGIPERTFRLGVTVAAWGQPRDSARCPRHRSAGR